MSDKEIDKILDSKIDDNELNEVSGGKCVVLGSWGKGNCTSTYYKEQCAATVEAGSLCSSDDYCKVGDVDYNCASNSSYKKN